MRKSLRLPHPIVLLLCAVIIAALLTWVLPAGEYGRHADPATGRQVVVPGTYHSVGAAPVGILATAVSIPRGFIAAAEVIINVLLAGGAVVVLEKAGVLQRAVGALTGRLKSQGLVAIPIVTLFFYLMGGLDNMLEEIIPLIPMMVLLARAIGVDGITAVAMSAGAAMTGASFSPVNPFQAGIALKLAELPLSSGFALRSIMFLLGFVGWLLLVMRHAKRNRVEIEHASASDERLSVRDAIMLVSVLGPILIYTYGAIKLDWGFNELSAGFLIGGICAGIVGRLGTTRTTSMFLDGMNALLPAALLIGVARSISVVLTDGHIIDTILHGLALPLAGAPAGFAALLMIPFHMIVHIPVPSVSGHAVLTMPIMLPLSDLLGIPRTPTILAYQTGAGLIDLVMPTNGALMAILLGANIGYEKWLRFAVPAMLLMVLVGVVGILFAMGGM